MAAVIIPQQSVTLTKPLLLLVISAIICNASLASLAAETLESDSSFSDNTELVLSTISLSDWLREKGSGFKDGVLEVERNGVVLLKENTREMRVAVVVWFGFGKSLESGGGGECENKRERQEEEPKFTVIFLFSF